MNCGKYKEMIPEYLSGELDADSVSEFEAHIKDCSGCRTALETERTLLAMAGEELLDVPEGLNASVLMKLPAERPVFIFSYARYAVAASLFLILTLSYIFFGPDKAVVPVNTALNNGNIASTYSNEYLIGSDYDELVSYKTELYDEDKWTSDDTDIFQSEDDLINDLLTLEELESYDDYLTSL